MTPWPGSQAAQNHHKHHHHHHGRNSSLKAERRSGDLDAGSSKPVAHGPAAHPSLKAGDLPHAADFVPAHRPPAPSARPSVLAPHAPAPGPRPSFAQRITHVSPSTRPSVIAVVGDTIPESAQDIRAKLARVHGGGAGGAPAMLREMSRARESTSVNPADAAATSGGFVLQGHSDAVPIERRPMPAKKLWAVQAKKAAGIDTSISAQLFHAVKTAVEELGPPSSRRKAFWCGELPPL